MFIDSFFFFFNDTATTEIYTLSLHDALPIFAGLELLRLLGRDGLARRDARAVGVERLVLVARDLARGVLRSEEHTSELQSRSDLVCRLLLEKKNKSVSP